MPHYVYQLFLVLLLTGGFLGSAKAQLESIENLEESTSPGFFKTHVKDLFKGFKDFGSPFTMNAGIGLNMRSYSAYGGDPRQDPFFYTLNAHANVRIYKIDLPFSILISAKNQTSSTPNFQELIDNFRNNFRARRDRFTRFGMSPHYKWIRLHLGHRSMNFSQFTLANLNFFGAGMELTPGNVRVAGMYGRLARAEPIDLSLVTPNIPVYERIGYGAKVGYGDQDQSIDLILFGARDDVNSIDIPEDTPEQPAPEQNAVIGVNVQKLFFERFRFRTEFAYSLLNPNSEDAIISDNRFPDFLFTERTTTETYTAVDAGLDYEGSGFTAGVGYRRIAPEYRSLGAYFFNNDIRDLLGKLSFGMFDGRVNVNLSGGVQSNNLDNSKPSTTQRGIYSADVAYAHEAFSAGANYSNNTTDVGFVLNQELDSLNAVIISQDAGVNLNYSLPSGEGGNQHVFTVTGNVQQVTDDIDNPQVSATSRLVSANFGYNLLLTGPQIRFSSRLNYNQNELAQMLLRRYGAGVGLAKSFSEGKINLGIDLNLFLNSNEEGGSSNNLNGQFRSAFQLGKGFSINMNWGLLRTDAETMEAFSELTGNLGLQYNFSIQPGGRKDQSGSEASN